MSEPTPEQEQRAATLAGRIDEMQRRQNGYMPVKLLTNLLLDFQADASRAAAAKAYREAADLMCSACRCDGPPDEQGYHFGVESCQAWPIPARVRSLAEPGGE